MVSLVKPIYGLVAAAGIIVFLLSPANAVEAPRGTIEDPIIDSKMTDTEAFDALDPKCPGEIRRRQTLIAVVYYGPDRRVHQGQLVLDKDVENDVREIFDLMLETKFPIASVIPMSNPKFRRNGRWDDQLSMLANNTSAFNYRTIAGSNKVSNHATGRAIDINPFLNPNIKGMVVSPPGAKYDVRVEGTLPARHPVVKAFLARGWRWGGNWRMLKDYQHFEKPNSTKSK